MPQTLPAVTFPPEVQDLVGAARTDGYSEVKSTQGYGLLVVSADRAAELIATGNWVAYP